MPITINLLEDQQKQESAHLYDPLQIVLRISLAVGVILALAFGWVGYMKFQALQKRNQIAIELASLEKDERRLNDLQKRREETNRQIANFYKYISSRTLWASQLNSIKELVPQDIYFTQISGSSYIGRARRPEGSEAEAVQTTITIIGRVRSEKFVELVRLLLDNLRKDEFFSAQVEKPEDIELGGDIRFSPPAPGGKYSGPEADFKIICRLKPRFLQ